MARPFWLEGIVNDETVIITSPAGGRIGKQCARFPCTISTAIEAESGLVMDRRSPAHLIQHLTVADGPDFAGP